MFLSIAFHSERLMIILIFDYVKIVCIVPLFNLYQTMGPNVFYNRIDSQLKPVKFSDPPAISCTTPIMVLSFRFLGSRFIVKSTPNNCLKRFNAGKFK